MQKIAIAKVTDLQNGQMQQIAVGKSQILLSKINDRFYATGAFCPHYGAPLETGVLCGEQIICPWHNACFNAIAGQQQEPPGLDSLATYVTEVVGKEVIVKLPDEIVSSRTLEMAKCVEDQDNRVFIVLGAGAAGIHAVEKLRQWDQILIDGDLEQPNFLAFYLQDNHIMAVAGIDRDRDIAAISELMRQQKMPDATTLKNQKFNWQNLLTTNN